MAAETSLVPEDATDIIARVRAEIELIVGLIRRPIELSSRLVETAPPARSDAAGLAEPAAQAIS